jgi:hypothetical protein
MRSLCTCLAGTILAATLIVLAPGCGGGASSDFAKTPDPSKKMNPAVDMPTLQDLQKKDKKAK